MLTKLKKLKKKLKSKINLKIKFICKQLGRIWKTMFLPKFKKWTDINNLESETNQLRYQWIDLTF